MFTNIIVIDIVLYRGPCKHIIINDGMVTPIFPSLITHESLGGWPRGPCILLFVLAISLVFDA